MFTLILTSVTFAQAPEKTEIKIPNSLAKFNLIKLPDGTYEKDGQKTVIKNLWISETEITWDVYSIYAFKLDLTQEQQAVGFEAKSRPSKPYGAPDRGYGFKGYPAVGMHWNAAEFFCKWISEKTGKKFRLPTEAEWEYAAKAGGGMPANVDTVSWNWDTAEDKTMPVGKKTPNAWGLYDVLGNASEWCLAPDGTRVVRGGSFKEKKNEINFTFRAPLSPKWQEADAHTPKSVWWLSDGPQVGIRLICEG